MSAVPHINPTAFIGRPVSGLPTPSLILNKSILERNAQIMLRDVEEKGILFRPHIKTLKCAEATRLSTGNGVHKKVVASTLAEIWGLLPLAKEGIIEEVAYGMPLPPSALPELAHLSQHLRIVIFIDNVAHIDTLEAFGARNPQLPKWPAFIKLDAGYGRAGIPSSSSKLAKLITKASLSEKVELVGIYSHSGQSYGTTNDAEDGKTTTGVMDGEVAALLKAAELLPLPGKGGFILSFGATPQAHVVQQLQTKGRLRKGWALELHAGNFLVKDLQQVSTGCCDFESQALRLLVEVCSIYPERNEALINAGRLALTSETSPKFPGFATVASVAPPTGVWNTSISTDVAGNVERVVGGAEWYVKRVSQEHGIMATSGTGKVEDVWQIGDTVLLYVSHACITAAAHPWYYVVNERDVVVDVWTPWKGW